MTRVLREGIRNSRLNLSTETFYTEDALDLSCRAKEWITSVTEGYRDMVQLHTHQALGGLLNISQDELDFFRDHQHETDPVFHTFFNLNGAAEEYLKNCGYPIQIFPSNLILVFNHCPLITQGQNLQPLRDLTYTSSKYISRHAITGNELSQKLGLVFKRINEKGDHKPDYYYIWLVNPRRQQTK